MEQITPEVKLTSLKPDQVWQKLDLDHAELEQVKALQESGNEDAAALRLLAYYRRRYPLQESTGPKEEMARADSITRHVFQFGPYEPADYGDQMEWESDPRQDIEWVASLYRFPWAATLATAYAQTREERYAEAFVELTTDWIAKHPLEARMMQHPVYANWVDFPWLDIQTGIRATNICRAFKALVHAEAFTPEFLLTLMASLYDHQVKTQRLPMGQVHNKAIFEQRGFVNVATTFPEFRESEAWLTLALERTEESLLAQTTDDGVQREWSGGYHSGVLRDAVEIMDKMAAAGLDVSEEYRQRVRRMYDYIFWISTPDLGYPMFGDCSRPWPSPAEREKMPFYPILREASERFDDPKYAALADLQPDLLPRQTSHAFADAGMYTLRNEWGPEQVYMALHCSPPAISGHDQPDNGTFELYGLGRWLMTDSGFYVYGHDPVARTWHRQTCVHQTLTLNEEDTAVDGKLLLWQPSDDGDVLAVENPSYAALTHRRTAWFPGRRFFVLLDEALGETEGNVELHFQLAVGEAAADPRLKCATTCFDDANVLVWAGPDAPVTLSEETGWFAWSYGHRKPRMALRLRHEDQAPARFVTLLLPYPGRHAPNVGIKEVTEDAVTVEVGAETWHLTRDLQKGTAACRKKT